MKKFLLLCYLLMFAFQAEGFNSVIEYENNAQEKMNFGYLSTINPCFGSGKLVTVFEVADFKNLYIPPVQSPDEIMPNMPNTVYKTALGAFAVRAVVYSPAIFASPFSLLAMAAEYIAMIDVCTNAYILQPHEYVNRDILGLKCKKDKANKYFFQEKVINTGPDAQTIKPFTQDDIPFYYTCNPKFDFANPNTPLTTERQVGKNYGYMGDTSEFCTGRLGQIARNNDFQSAIGSVKLEFVPGIEKFFSWFEPNYGEPCNARLKKGPLILKVTGETKRMPGWGLNSWFAYYKFDFDTNKIKICVAEPYLMIPVKVGCSYIPQPAAESPVDPFIEEYVQNTTCKYFMSGRTDLKSLGEALPDEDDYGVNKENVKRFLKSEFHLVSTVVSCVKDMLYKVFIDENPNDEYTSFFLTVQKALKGIVFATLVLYVVVSGINLVIDPELYKNRGELIMLVIKFALVFYFAVGNAWFERKSNGEITGFLPMLLEAPAEVTSIILNAYNQNDPIGFCKYRLSGRELFDERIVRDGEVTKPLTYTTKLQGVKMSVFDLIDCKLVNYMNFGSCKYDVAGIILMWISSICFWTGGVGWVLGIVCLIYLFLLLLTIFKLVHVFILSMFLMVILVFLSPIFVLFALFKQTMPIFQTWFKMLIGYMLYPGLCFVYVSFMLTTLDLSYYGALDEKYFEGKGGYFNLVEVCQKASEPSVLCTTVDILGYDNPCYNYNSTISSKFYDEVDLLLFKVRTLKKDIAYQYLKSLGKLLLFAFLFYLLMNSMLDFTAVILGVWGFSSTSKGGMNILNPLKAIFGGGK